MAENLMTKVKKKKGFTLIELIIVVAIIAILAALAIPKLMGTQDNAKKKTDIANAKIIHDTTAKLITEGTITDAMITGGTHFQVASAATSAAAGVLWSELQSKPKATYKSHKDFYVTIGSDKSIKVTVDSDTGDEVYPDASGSTDYK
jgi:type IV pilus assembly protein PilA